MLCLLCHLHHGITHFCRRRRGFFGTCRILLCNCRQILYHIDNLHSGLIKLLGLLRNSTDSINGFLNAIIYFMEGFLCIGYIFILPADHLLNILHSIYRLLGICHQLVNNVADLSCRFIRLLCELLNLGCYNCKASSLLSGTCSLDGGIQRQKIGFLCNISDDISCFLNFQRRSIRGIRLLINGANCCFGLVIYFIKLFQNVQSFLCGGPHSSCTIAQLFNLFVCFFDHIPHQYDILGCCLGFLCLGGCALGNFGNSLLHIIYGCRSMGCGFTHISRSFI